MSLPLDSVYQDSDGFVNVAVQLAHCFVLQDSSDSGKKLEALSECQHSRKGWMGGNHSLNIDSVLGCRHHGRLDNLQKLPTKVGELSN